MTNKVVFWLSFVVMVIGGLADILQIFEQVRAL